MNYSNLLSKAWNTIWNNKFLILLGVLAALGSGGGGNGGSGGRGNVNPQPGGFSGGPGGNVCAQITSGFAQMGVHGAAIAAAVAVIMLIVVLIGTVLWIVRRLGQGGMISGVNEIENGRGSSFSLAFGAAWGKVWQLIGIGLIAGIPGIVALVVLGVTFYSFIAGGDWQARCLAMSSGDPRLLAQAFAGVGALWGGAVALVCALGLAGAILAAVRVFADRACMTENLGVLESYSRGMDILRANFGQAFLLFLIQIALAVAAWVVLLIPSFIIGLCCLLWPILWLIGGTFQAYFSTLWTLAWREWTGGKPQGEPVGATPAPLG